MLQLGQSLREGEKLADDFGVEFVLDAIHGRAPNQ